MEPQTKRQRSPDPIGITQINIHPPKAGGDLIKFLCALCVSAVIFTGCQTLPDVDSSQQTVDRESPSEICNLESEISNLIAQLGSDDWQTREQATQELIKLGESIMPELEKVYHSTQDPEVKLRIKLIADEVGYILNPKLREQVKLWLEQLYSSDNEKRMEAFDKLIKSGKGGIKVLKRELGEQLRAWIVNILKEMAGYRKREDEWNIGANRIKGLGKESIPILILEIANDNEFIGTVASDLLIDWTDREDAPTFNPMISDEKNNISRDWQTWWLKNRDKY